jgi:hypothetical protein
VANKSIGKYINLRSEKKGQKSVFFSYYSKDILTNHMVSVLNC